MIPSIGRIVHYTLDESDVSIIKATRETKSRAADKDPDAKCCILGNPVAVGDVYPAMITRVFSPEPDEHTCVQLQVFLDGPDQHWVSSALQGTPGDLRHWFEAPRK